MLCHDVGQLDSVSGKEAHPKLIFGKFDFFLAGNSRNGPVEEIELLLDRNDYRTQAAVATSLQARYQAPSNADFWPHEFCDRIDLQRSNLPEVSPAVIECLGRVRPGDHNPVKFQLFQCNPHCGPENPNLQL